MSCKLCTKCQTLKDTRTFGIDRRNPSGLNSYCKDCLREYRESRKSAKALYDKTYRDVNRNLLKNKQHNYYKALREQALSVLGNKCKCCGEHRKEFLAIDHIHGGGENHRSKIKKLLVSWLIENNYPPGFQILCHNCNLAKAFYKQCPHQAGI